MKISVMSYNHATSTKQRLRLLPALYRPVPRNLGLLTFDPFQELLPSFILLLFFHLQPTLLHLGKPLLLLRVAICRYSRRDALYGQRGVMNVRDGKSGCFSFLRRRIVRLVLVALSRVHLQTGGREGQGDVMPGRMQYRLRQQIM